MAPISWYRDRELHLVDSLVCSLLLDNQQQAPQEDNFRGKVTIIFLVPRHTLFLSKHQLRLNLNMSI